MRFIRNTLVFAFLQGFFEHLPYEPDGRTHEYDSRWSEAYDRGWNLADSLMRRTGKDY